MTESDPSPHLSAEPQSERGAPGSRDEGGPLETEERPAGDPHSQDITGVNDITHGGLSAGDQGG